MIDRPRRVGVVLAGGFSTRFGDADKALAPVHGTPMLRRVVDRLGAVTDAVVVNCRADQRDAFASVLVDCDAPVAFAIDRVSDDGPLLGLAGALAVHDAPVTVVVACDMPFVDPDFLSFLCDERVASTADAALASPGGMPQPAQAVLSTGPAKTAARETIGADEASLRAMYDRLDVRVVDEDTVASRGFGRSLVDVNTRDSLPDRSRSATGEIATQPTDGSGV